MFLPFLGVADIINLAIRIALGGLRESPILQGINKGLSIFIKITIDRVLQLDEGLPE